jgi:hypothetical protein
MGLTIYDWKFDAIPTDELLACCYWEYARESAFIRKTMQGFREYVLGAGKTEDEIKKVYSEMDAIKAIGYGSEVFVAGCSFPRERHTQSADPKLPDYAHPHAPPITGNFPDPWQSLTLVERQWRAHLRDDTEVFQINPIGLEHWSVAKHMARLCEAVIQGRDLRRKLWGQKYQRIESEGKQIIIAGAPAPPNEEPVRARVRCPFGEALVVRIAWEYYSNEEIIRYFRRWIKEIRPKTFAEPERRGRNKARDLRAKLRDLGAMRLMHFATVAGMRAPFPEAAKYFARCESKHWSAARKRAISNFRLFLPTLPEGEVPLHKATKGGRAK